VPWTAVAVVALVAAAAAGTYHFLLSSKPADVVEEYLDAVKNGNEEKRDRLSSKDTAGQSPLPAVLRIADYEVERDSVSFEGGQAQVPTKVALVVDPLTIGLERAVLADKLMAHLKKRPVRANLVLVKERLNWRIDQRQTQGAFVESAVREMGPELKNQLMGAWMRGEAARPGGGERPRPAPPGGAEPPRLGATRRR